jgi:pimeloyl-ACP methyl ester carboxylesterase
VSVYAELQRRLLCEGVGSLTFDEVGTGKSSGSYELTATTASLAADVHGLLAHLGELDSVLSDRIFVVGHSEGGVIAAMVASSDTRVAGVALLAASAYRGDRIMAYQWVTHAETYGRSLSTMRDQHDRRILSDRWYRDFLAFDPSVYYPRISSPVLIVQGDRDIDVDPLQADSIFRLVNRGRARELRCVRFADTDHTSTDMEHHRWKPHEGTLREIVSFITRLATQSNAMSTARDERLVSCQRVGRSVVP